MIYDRNEEKIRICHICSNYDKFYIDFMEEQLARNMDLRVFYFRAKERGLPDVDAPYLDLRLNYSNWDRPFFLLKENKVWEDFLDLYENNEFNILHAHTVFSNGYIALKAKKKFGIPYVVSVRDMDINLFFKYRFNLRRIGIEILKEADKIIFISEPYKVLLISTYVPKKYHQEFIEKSHIITNGINKFYLENKNYKNGIDVSDEIKIITVGLISKRKNQLKVLEAVRILNEMGFKASYTVIGKVLDDKVYNKLKMSSYVNYIPFMSKEELLSEYRKADIFVMPSKTETFGLTYAEAMSQGLPVIYTKGQGFDGQFEEGEVGYSVRSNNASQIANSIVKILNNYTHISNRCTMLSDRFQWELIVKKYTRIYSDVINLERSDNDE